MRFHSLPKVKVESYFQWSVEQHACIKRGAPLCVSFSVAFLGVSDKKEINSQTYGTFSLVI